MARQMYIDQTRISHIITDVWMEGSILYGIIESAQTQTGKDFKGLICQGSEVAFSMRGVGPVKETDKGYVVVDEPLNILTWDWVIHPSHSMAYMEKVLTEDTINLLFGTNQFKLSEASDYQVNKIQSEILTEGLVNPLETYQIKDYIVNASRNIKNISESLQFDISNINNIKINENRNTVDIYQNSEILRVYLEDYLVEDLDHYLINSIGK